MKIDLNPKQEQKKTRETCSPSAFPVRIDATCADPLKDQKTKGNLQPLCVPWSESTPPA
ncbi:hypothetical protein AXF42_Ash004612 [Apostasia shenzhenica]|uniref:Uncharacterized protein n=1 Tax=Apostasia shenzhenica TaxID=1088818 RepID=A0A2I0BH60_9ASPA|nr:hypothetical protein AXF42_Ash004612 [Apostasia shenzhenica]